MENKGKQKWSTTTFPRNLLSTEKTLLTKGKWQTSLITFCKNWSKAGREIQPSKYSLESSVDSINTKLIEKTVSINKLKEAFLSHKSNKTLGIKDIIIDKLAIIHKCQYN